MPSSPKPGDPDFVPRYSPLDLDPIRQRIEERREAAKCLDETKRLIIESDTDMMAELVLAVTNLRVALDIAKGLHLAASTRPASSDGPMQKCFSCPNWTTLATAQCVVCRTSTVVDDPYGHEEP